MSQDQVRLASEQVDLTDRVMRSTTVAASPSAATETIIATATLPANLRAGQIVLLFGFAAFTVGTAGVTARLRIKQTDASGATKADSGALTVTAADLRSATVLGVDTAEALTGQVYVLTLAVGSASAVSTVSNVALFGLVI
jgi:hypothetical protein